MAAPTPPPSRPLRGSRLSSFYPSQPSEGPSLSSLDSAFQLQEYISLLIRRNPHDVDAVVSIPERSKLNASGEEKPDEGSEKDSRGEPAVDEACWIYEQLRRLAQDLSHPLITLLQQECTRQSCPEMKAGEWLYLCVAHGNDGAMEQCCAIDYILHTLDSATALLNSPRTFPSRISIPATSVRHFSSLARRLGRIFAHAYFHHREAFEQSEAESSLYSRFLALTSKFNLVPAEFLVIPPRMSASQQSQDSDSDRNRDVEPPRLLAAHPHSNTNAEHQERQQQQPPHPHQQETQPSPVGYDVAEHPHPHPLRELSPEKPSPIQGSPRKFGRNRTDTMIFSDAAAIGEELRAQEPSPERLESRHGAGIADVRTHSVVEDVGKDASGGEEVVDDEEEIQSPMEIPDETSPVADKIAPEPTHTDEAQADTAPPAPEVAQQDPISAGSGDTEALLHQSELVMLAESKDVCDESVEDSPCASQPSTTATTTEDPNPTAEPESKEEGLPQTQDLVMLAESEQTCDPSKHPLDLKDDAPSEASSSAATTAAATATVCGMGSKKSAVAGEGEVGPGGFVMLAEPGEVCVPFPEDVPGELPTDVEGADEAHTHVPLTQTQTETQPADQEEEDVTAESAESPLDDDENQWTDTGAAVQEHTDDHGEKGDAKVEVDHPTEVNSEGMVKAPTDAEHVAEDKKDGEGPDEGKKEEVAEGQVADEANTTIEEDLVDVEKVLRE